MKILLDSKSLLLLFCFQMIVEKARSQIGKVSQPGIIQLCGFRNKGPDPNQSFNRIVGGQPARRHEFKWQVSMRLKHAGGLHHVCGGTIIGESWVVTAAHCTKGFKKERLVFVGGDHHIDASDSNEQLRTSDLIIAHENYNSQTQEHDIALVRLTRPWDFTTGTVAPACLPETGEEFPGVSCVVTGWGRDKEDGKSAKILQKVWVPIIRDEVCESSMSKLGYRGMIKNTMVCAGYDEGGKDACQGDSGGPLVCPGKGRLPVLIGIVSWGIGCARKGIPGIYTEVAHYSEWINKKVNENLATRINLWPFLDESSNQGTAFKGSDGKNKILPSQTKEPIYPHDEKLFLPLPTFDSSEESDDSSEERF